MKIVVSYRGAPRIRGWETGAMVAKAFRQLGHDVVEFGNIYQTSQRLPPNSDAMWDEADLWLYCEMNDADPQYHELNTFSVRKTACWLFDTSYYNDRCKSIVDYFRFDHIFLANPLTIREYKVWGYNNVHYLPYACDPELHSRPPEYPKTRDVALVGSIRSDRRLLVDALAKHDLDLQLVGGVFREQYIDTLASARIVINQNPPEGRGLLNMRFFEAQAAGALLLTEQEDLQANTEISRQSPMSASYTTVEDLANLCRALLESPGPLSYVTGTRQQLMLANHTYKNRCQQIIQSVFPHEQA